MPQGIREFATVQGESSKSVGGTSAWDGRRRTISLRPAYGVDNYCSVTLSDRRSERRSDIDPVRYL